MADDTFFTPAPTPESQGIPSRAILDFVQRIDAERICMHGFLLVRNDRIAAEGYWSPWSADRKHRMYSVSKSFVSLAVGLMIDEGKLSLEDRVADHFPDKLPEDPHRWITDMTVRDLLTMSTAHTRTTYTRDDPDWVWTFFNTAPSHPPGTIFSYDTSATTVLNALVERLAGKPFLDYMRPRFLDPIGFSPDAFCIRTPEGGSWGGSGVLCTLRDLAKVGLACLNAGRYGDAQLLPADYVRAATSKQIDNAIRGHHGYGYQIWRDPGDGFSFRGMGSQYAIGYPDRRFLFTCISDTQGAPSGSAIPAVMREEILPHLSDGPLPEDPDAHAELTETIDRLAVLPIPGNKDAEAAAEVNAAWYDLEDNPIGITRMRVCLDGDSGRWEYTNGQGDNVVSFGIGKQVAGTFPQRNYFADQIGTRSDNAYDCTASAAWADDRTLNVEVYITDIHLGGLRMSFACKGNEISVFMTKQAEWFLDEYTGWAGGKRA